jgi:cell division protease FtsH
MQPPAGPRLPGWIWIAALIFGILWWGTFGEEQAGHSIPYSDFKIFIARGEVVEAAVSEHAIIGRLEFDPGVTEPPRPELPEAEAGAIGPWRFKTFRVEDPDLVKELMAAKVDISGVPASSSLSNFWFALLLLAPIILMLFLFRGAAAAGRSMMAIGKGGLSHLIDEKTGVTFADVAGCDESKSELEEVVDFLKAPGRYREIGAKIPKGVLLVGPPGTGKTLMARAVAGEAGVPFFSMSGSDFVEMFVGVGASRVRDLFDEAKKHSPCIIFLDELDAIGRQRGVHVGAVNDEREQTLNQLLVELDGFEPNAGVILLAATNRPDVLDPALLRPGRFDRQVVLDAPDLAGREAILKVHARGKKLAEDVDLHPVAQGTPGFSGADLANTLNEAALLAARDGRKVIVQHDIEEAVERVVAGPQRKSRRLSDGEKRRVAIHESGHAIVASHCEHADPVHKISIVPRGRAALGYTLQFPAEDQYLKTEDELLDQLRSLLGGRASEELVLGEVSTGAENDLERATVIARQIICFYGMGESVGLTHCGSRQVPVYLTGTDYGGAQLDCSDETARQIDLEVKAMLSRCYADARELLTRHRAELDRVSGALLLRESLEEEEFHHLLAGGSSGGDEAPGGKRPEPAAGAVP